MRLPAAALIGFTALLQPGYPVIRVTGEPPRWKLEPLSVIVSPDGAGFSRIYGLLVDPKGGVVIVDAKEKVIYRFSDQGKPLGTTGRVGSGPAEFRVPYAIAWMGEEMMVYDPMNSRISRWDRNGNLTGQLPNNARLTGQIPAFAGAGGTVWLRQGGLGPSGKYQSNYTRISATGPRDTIWYPYVPQPAPNSEPPKGHDGYVVCVQKGSFSWFYSPFSESAEKTVVTLDGRLLAVGGVDYRLAVMRAPGDTLKVLEHVVTRAPISDSEWKAGLREYEEHMAANSGASCSGRQVRPKAKPAIRDLATDPTGRVWVERHTAQGFLWEAWQGDKVVGSFAMPDSSRNVLTSFSADRVAFARYREEDGGYEVRMYRIRP
jgi:hypothetical protein